MVAETTTLPIDLTKTRFQLHSPSATNAFRVVADILRHQGLLGLYRGLSPALLRHLFYTPIWIVGYEYLQRLAVVSAAGDGGSVSISTMGLLGGLSGVIA